MAVNTDPPLDAKNEDDGPIIIPHKFSNYDDNEYAGNHPMPLQLINIMLSALFYPDQYDMVMAQYGYSVSDPFDDRRHAAREVRSEFSSLAGAQKLSGHPEGLEGRQADEIRLDKLPETPRDILDAAVVANAYGRLNMQGQFGNAAAQPAMEHATLDAEKVQPETAPTPV